MEFLPPTRISFPGGDLTLVVGRAKWEYVVSTALLAEASPVLKGKITKEKNEAMSNGRTTWKVTLPRDKERPFGYILSLVHGQIHQVPREPEITEFMSVIKSAKRYGMLRTLEPVAGAWVEALAEADAEDLLVVSWHLGNKNGVKNAVETIMMEFELIEVRFFTCVDFCAGIIEFGQHMMKLWTEAAAALVHVLESLKKKVLDGRPFHEVYLEYPKPSYYFLEAVGRLQIRKLIEDNPDERRCWMDSLLDLEDLLMEIHLGYKEAVDADAKNILAEFRLAIAETQREFKRRAGGLQELPNIKEMLQENRQAVHGEIGDDVSSDN